MSTEQVKNEDLSKSIDALLDEVFSEVVEKGSPLDLAMDNKTKADDAVKMAPSMQKDEARGAGRPKQISEVPQVDMDGKRDSEYDDAIAEASGEKEPEEAKKQSKAIDQVSKEGHMGGTSKAPKMPPFKKSEDDEEYREFLEFKKSKAEAAAKAAKEEELKKAESSKKEQEELRKSLQETQSMAAKLVRENEELRKSFAETSALIKAMASQPVRSKSITGIEALEKSVDPSNKEPEAFSKAEILDAAFELAKSGKIKDTVVAEIEMTNRCSDQEARNLIERHLEGKN